VKDKVPSSYVVARAAQLNRWPTNSMRIPQLILFGLLCLLAAGCSLVRLSPEEIAVYEQLSSDQPYTYSHEEVCSVHGVRTEFRSVPSHGGFAVLPPRAHVRARLRLFPNSFPYTLSGWCEQVGTFYVERWVCPACRAAELRWLQSHGYDIPEELLLEVPPQQDHIGDASTP
jgi:hypothetical protein